MPLASNRLHPVHLLSFLLLTATCHAQQLGAENILDEEEEPVSRYAVEVILFTYGASVTAGTEVFMPVEPPPAENYDDMAPGALDNEFIFGDGAARNDDLQRITGEDAGNPATDSFGTFADPGMSMDTAAEDAEVATIDESDAIAIMDEESLRDALYASVDLTQPLEEVVTDAARIEFNPLLDEELTLADAHERLLRLDAYKPVLWTGWTQVVLEESESPTLNLRRLGSLPLDMEGELKLYLGRFVHLDVDISLEQRVIVESEQATRFDYPAADTRYGEFGDYTRESRYRERPKTSTIVYRIDDDRIMRNGETRYFDHPKFGLIARLTLVEEAESVTDPALLPDLLPGNAGSQL